MEKEMDKFLTSVIESNGYNRIMNDNLTIFGNTHEFFILENFEKDEMDDFFKSEKLDSVIAKFQEFECEKMKKNTSIFVLIKVDKIEEIYYQYLNKIISIEEDEYYFRKYVVLYTEMGVSELEPNVQDILNYIQFEDSDGFRYFDKFENDMFFDDAYFIAMELMIKLPFINFPSSNDRFFTIEDKIKLQIEDKGLKEQEEQVKKILKKLDNDLIKEQLKDSAVLDDLKHILGEVDL